MLNKKKSIPKGQTINKNFITRSHPKILFESESKWSFQFANLFSTCICVSVHIYVNDPPPSHSRQAFNSISFQFHTFLTIFTRKQFYFSFFSCLLFHLISAAMKIHFHLWICFYVCMSVCGGLCMYIHDYPHILCETDCKVTLKNECWMDQRSFGGYNEAGKKNKMRI